MAAHSYVVFEDKPWIRPHHVPIAAMDDRRRPSGNGRGRGFPPSAVLDRGIGKLHLKQRGPIVARLIVIIDVVEKTVLNRDPAPLDNVVRRNECQVVLGQGAWDGTGVADAAVPKGDVLDIHPAVIPSSHRDDPGIDLVL